jgi:hypothetical protein
MTHSDAEVYALFCQSTIESLRARLGREVSAQEQRCIWNVGSLMMLESVERTFQEGSLADVERTLGTMPQWTDERFRRVLSSMVERLPQWLGRPATDAERHALGNVEHIGALASLEERLTSVPPDQREAALHDTLAPLL